MIRRTLSILGLLAGVALCVAASAGPKVLYEKDSAYSTIVVTEDDEGLRTLWFGLGGARQSVVKPGCPDHVQLPYAQAMPVGLAFAAKPRHVLIVGLGGGTIPTFLHKHYPKTAIDVVEIDPDVVEVAKKYFGFREDSTMHAHVDDGRRFIEKHPEAYDIIFLDAFGPGGIPHDLTTREFLRAARRALNPKGIVVADVWSRSSNPLYDSMVRTYQDVFDELYILDVRGAGNKVLIALSWEERVERDDLARRARMISKEKQFPFDMGEIVMYGFRYAEESNSGGRVLTDGGEAQR